MGLASVGKPLPPLDPEQQKEGALIRTAAIALEERLQPPPPGRREPGIQASVSPFSYLPGSCRGCHWPNPVPSRVQLH